MHILSSPLRDRITSLTRIITDYNRKKETINFPSKANVSAGNELKSLDWLNTLSLTPRAFATVVLTGTGFGEDIHEQTHNAIPKLNFSSWWRYRDILQLFLELARFEIHLRRVESGDGRPQLMLNQTARPFINLPKRHHVKSHLLRPVVWTSVHLLVFYDSTWGYIRIVNETLRKTNESFIRTCIGNDYLDYGYHS
ncbi:hypothetical protein BDN72DRAFT_860008 [Pluteus cervinus]|uniref:Uncharacterized protein n=1 Tax=Pluteus cervinus TaxID=181527 RepID=A0ACD3ALF3_9AGAR|nr:hypothetical protein BDN72DRAFT_860008 [Pluteus cervinus]